MSAVLSARPRAAMFAFRVVTAAAVGVGALTFAGGSATAAAPDQGPAAGRAAVAGASGTDAFLKEQGTFLARQERLDLFKSWLVTRPGIGTSGYVGSVHDADHLTVTLLWHGSSPLQRQAVAEAARRGITVKFEQRKYDLPHLQAATAATWAKAAAGGLPGFRISYIAGVTAGYDGIVVHGSATGPAAHHGATRPFAGTVDGTAAEFVAGDDALPASGTRSDDYPAFNAGDYMISPRTGDTCSTGFAIRVSGVDRITTARHCVANDYKARAGSHTYGTGLLDSHSGAARVLTGAGGHWMYDGAYNNAAGYSKKVVGFGDVGIYDKVCTSGGNSGVHCNIQVDAENVSWNDGYGDTSTIHATQRTPGTIAIIQGDSGGPVLTLAGSGQVYAAGMIQAVNQYVSNCGPVFDGGDNKCGTGLFFTSMRTVVNSISGASLVTG